MKLGKIDYINLLPFHIFLKKLSIQNRYKQAINKNKSYPSKINNLFLKKRIDAAFVSSIISRNKKTLNAGIVADGEVFSVLNIFGEDSEDIESQTSNALAKILGIKGKTIIGDKALKYRFSNNEGFLDLGDEWKKKYNLPFVFAVFCYNKNGELYKKIINSFLKTNIKIPRYILLEYAKRGGFTASQILYYLTKISYKIDKKGEISLKKFLEKARR